MGSGRSVEQQDTSPKAIIDYLNSLFAYALSLGMTYEQYWYDDPYLINSYIKADEIRKVKRNNELWLQGYYVYHAVGCLVPVLNPFSKEHKAKKYLEAPVPITELEQEEYNAKRNKKIMAKLDSLVGKKLGG